MRRSVLIVFLGVVLLLRCSTALHMFHYSVVFRLFCQYLVVCSTSVLCSVVPCSGVSGFIVCLYLLSINLKQVSFKSRRIILYKSKPI